jgi:hypothetical protein
VPLPVASEIYRPLHLHRQTRKAGHFVAIRDAAVIFALRSLLGVPEQVGASDMMVVADLAATHAAEKLLCPVRASAVEAVGLLMVDPPRLVVAA